MEILNQIANILHYAVSFFIIISIIVFVHEFGHFYVARLCGVKIDEFSIGFGKELRGWTDKHGTRWKISLLPFGGFVKMHGDASEASNPDINRLESMSAEEKKISFHYKPLWQKFIIVLSGPASNFLFAIFVLTLLFMAYGKLKLDAPPLANRVLAGSAAEKAGLQKGDLILSVNEQKITRFTELPKMFAMSANETFDLTYKRNDEIIKTKITPVMTEDTDMHGNKVRIGRIGVEPPPMEISEESFVRLGPVEAVGAAVGEVYSQCRNMLKGIKQIVSGVRSSKELGGPVKIMEYSGQSTQKIYSAVVCVINGDSGCGKMARDGFLLALSFMVMISVMLGLVNLFPVPMLDGGHLMFYIIEGVMRRPVHEKAQEWLFRFGFAFLIMLMVYATYNDIVSFAQKYINS